MRAMLLVTALCCVAWVPPVAGGGGRVFAWQDAQGVPQFSDRPGNAGATEIRPGQVRMSVVDTAPARAQGQDNPMRSVIRREIRHQQRNRERERRETLAEMDRHEQRCRHYREQLAEAERARQRARARELEDTWLARCR